ncbi:endoribonuclease ysh1, partial [Oleoguttula sp. CCFEE 5521]
NGVSRALLERWAPDPKNGVVITGYSVEGTMAKEIMKEPDSIPSVMGARNNPSLAPGRKVGEEKTMIPRRCTVQEFSFAAHVDGSENRAFIEEVNAPVVVLVHGERGNMMRMRSRLLGLGKFKVYSPANCEEVRIPFRRDKVAKVVGSLASTWTPGEANGSDAKRARPDAADGQTLSGILVQSDHKLSLMSPADLREYAGLATTTITCRQRITLAAASLDLILWSLRGTFGAVTVTKPEDSASEGDQLISLPDTAVQILAHGSSDGSVGGEYTLLWPGNAANDAIADAVMAVLLSVETSPAAMRHTSSPHSHEAPHPLHADTPELRLDALLMFLSSQFGEDALTPIVTPRNTETMDEVGRAKELARLHGLGIPVPGIEVRVDGIVAKVWFAGKGGDESEAAGVEVECKNRGFGERVRAVVEGGLKVVI